MFIHSMDMLGMIVELTQSANMPNNISPQNFAITPTLQPREFAKYKLVTTLRRLKVIRSIFHARKMAGQDASMEEILWRSPPHVQMMGGFLHSNNSE